jgi:UDP-2,3-diacylglucosamine pyrophosphatase LpxH
MSIDFTRAEHTIILSDIHLADAEPPHPENPLWKRYKRPELFVDRSFKTFLAHLQKSIHGSIELILNGDIFDFDSVLAIPRDPDFQVNWLEKMRGLNSEEKKSRFKMSVILQDHAVWVKALREFVLSNPGNRVVFVIGNHDIELHWPSVQQDVIAAMDLPEADRERVRFCEWFYLSNGDTLVEHGNQYDDYCVSSSPINPLIKKGNKAQVRLPFGNLAGKYMINGMGLMNPHVDSSFIKSSLWEYLAFYYRYMMRTQPLIVWTWFWSAAVTLVYSVREGLLPALRDPLTVDQRVEEIAQRANATPRMVWSLRELQVHPAIFNPLQIARELWLDRVFLLLLIVAACFWFFSILKLFIEVSFLWFVIPLVLLLPGFIFYARSVEPENEKIMKAILRRVPISARIAKVKRVVHGHTHRERHTVINQIEYLNTGTWSPAYEDVECKRPYGKKCYAWIHPPSASAEGSSERVSELLEWKEGEVQLIPAESPSTLEESFEERTA